MIALWLRGLPWRAVQEEGQRLSCVWDLFDLGDDCMVRSACALALAPMTTLFHS